MLCGYGEFGTPAIFYHSPVGKIAKKQFEGVRSC